MPKPEAGAEACLGFLAAYGGREQADTRLRPIVYGRSWTESCTDTFLRIGNSLPCWRPQTVGERWGNGGGMEGVRCGSYN